MPPRLNLEVLSDAAEGYILQSLRVPLLALWAKRLSELIARQQKLQMGFLVEERKYK